MAIIDPYGAERYGDGTTRQRSRCKVIVHTHVQSTPKKEYKINCSRDVISCSTSKTIKDGGGANFVLLPRRNYLNLIFPNDYVNIYFDPGDGRGWIRTFFGFIDRISRSVVAGENGETTTRFQITCSDFTKAFDRTQVYFNPYISQREDIIGEFAGTSNLGGLNLITKGVALHGSPADMVFSLSHVMLGFGSQFKAPDGYAQRNGAVDANRQARVDWASSRLSATVQKAIGEAGSIKKLEAQIQEEVNRATEIEYWESHASKYGAKDDPKKKASIRRRKYEEALRKRGIQDTGLGTPYYEAKLAEKNLGVTTVNLIDLIDWRYVEWKAIDGYVNAMSVSQQEGSLWSIMNAWSNGDVNELFCDLRPIAPDPNQGNSPGGKSDHDITKLYSHDDDELGENEGAVRYAPCVIMREYPFSTIWKLTPPSSIKVLGSPLKGDFYFGAIFSQDPNVPGRKVVEIPAIHEHLAGDPANVARKHLDVVCIDSRDINNEDIGRSDHDLCNWFEMYSDVSGGNVQGSRFLTRDIQPITNAISVIRHGLRVRRHETRFGRFSALNSPAAGEADSAITRKVVIRWVMLLDHWYQHNIEYLSGTFTTRALPELRVGYRLDIVDRKESYYVEGVNHNWVYNQPMQTSITVSRGQRNDPYPVYILPHRPGFEGERAEASRLGEIFHVKDASAIKRSIKMWGEPELENMSEQENLVDVIDGNRWWCSKGKGFKEAEFIPTKAEHDHQLETLRKKFSSIFEGKLIGVGESSAITEAAAGGWSSDSGDKGGGVK